MAKRVRSSPRTSSVILSVSIISVSIIGGIVLFPILGIGSILLDRKSTRLNSSHIQKSRMPSYA